jgi:hypothetical protein
MPRASLHTIGFSDFYSLRSVIISPNEVALYRYRRCLPASMSVSIKVPSLLVAMGGVKSIDEG